MCIHGEFNSCLFTVADPIVYSAFAGNHFLYSKRENLLPPPPPRPTPNTHTLLKSFAQVGCQIAKVRYEYTYMELNV